MERGAVMKKNEFEAIVKQMPDLTADGYTNIGSPMYRVKRKSFVEKAEYLQQSILSAKVLKQFRKSVLINAWQKKNALPSRIREIIEWHAQSPVSIGAIIVGAVYAGFKLERRFDENAAIDEPVLNIFSRQLEGEFSKLRVRQMIKKLAS